MLFNSRVTDAPRDGEAHSRGQAPSAPRKVHFLEGVFAAQGPPGMKLTEDMEDSTPPLDNVGAKVPPVTDAERGASYKEGPEQRDHVLLSLERQ